MMIGSLIKITGLKVGMSAKKWQRYNGKMDVESDAQCMLEQIWDKMGS